MRLAVIRFATIALLGGCASPPPPAPPPPAPKPVGPPTDTVRIPLNDLGARTYFGHAGGLYPGGNNLPPPDHDSAARAKRNIIRPVDINGDESPFGKFVLLSIGSTDATQAWCSERSAPPCGAWTFMGRASTDPAVNRYTLVVVNGAAPEQHAESWMSPTSPNYDRIKVARLAPLGLSENQVQIVWVNLSDARPTVPLPSDSADAYVFVTNLAQVIRTLKIRYPYLQLVFVSSPIYGGYSSSELYPEPYAYEEGFSVKWIVESQISEMRGTGPTTAAGSLNYQKKAAPVILWGPYLWANGASPRSDGFAWERADFEKDGAHPSQAGETKFASQLLEFFKTSVYTRCWFVSSQYCL
ncbi:MAG: hypothetical protein ABR585_01115 [Gemmatimonadaceae bacterium]